MTFFDPTKMELRVIVAYAPPKRGALGAARKRNPELKINFSGRPQGAPTTGLPRHAFPAFRPHTPRVKYLPGGPHLPQTTTATKNGGAN